MVSEEVVCLLLQRKVLLYDCIEEEGLEGKDKLVRTYCIFLCMSFMLSLVITTCDSKK